MIVDVAAALLPRPTVLADRPPARGTCRGQRCCRRPRPLGQLPADEFLREILELAQQVTAVEHAEDEGHLDEVSILPDPNVGALTQIFREYAPADTPVIIENVVTDIDTIVRQVRFTGWSQTQNGDGTPVGGPLAMRVRDG
jgi:hypothetical protein